MSTVSVIFLANHKNQYHNFIHDSHFSRSLLVFHLCPRTQAEGGLQKFYNHTWGLFNTLWMCCMQQSPWFALWASWGQNGWAAWQCNILWMSPACDFTTWVQDFRSSKLVVFSSVGGKFCLMVLSLGWRWKICQGHLVQCTSDYTSKRFFGNCRLKITKGSYQGRILPSKSW